MHSPAREYIDGRPSIVGCNRSCMTGHHVTCSSNIRTATCVSLSRGDSRRKNGGKNGGADRSLLAEVLGLTLHSLQRVQNEA